MASSEAYCLRRNNHTMDMIDDFEKMFREESLVDVTLSCEEGNIRAHRMVLSASSSYFKNIFTKFTSPYQYPVVIIKDITFHDLKAIVEFAYKGEVIVPQEHLSSVLKSAELLKVKGLSEVNNNKENKSQDGQKDGSGSGRKRRRKRKKSNGTENSAIEKNHHHHDHQENDDAADSPRDSSEMSSDYSTDDDMCKSGVTIEPVGRDLRPVSRPFHEGVRHTEADIEPTRLLEQSMITGDEAQENGNPVPRFQSNTNMTNVHSISGQMSSSEVKPMMFDEPSALMPQLGVPLSNNLPPNNTSNHPQSSSQGQNHLPAVSNSHCSMPGFDSSGLSSIPGPSSLPQANQVSQATHVSRPHHSQEQFLGSSHTSHSSHAHPHLPHPPHATQLLSAQMHPPLGCHSLTPLCIQSLSGKRHYQCPVCLKSFTEKGNMKRHTQIHLQQRNRYMCDLCTKCFAWKDNFNRHRRIAHSDLNQVK